MPDDDNQNTSDPEETTTPTENEGAGTETGSGDTPGSSSGSETGSESGSGSSDATETTTAKTADEILAEIKAAMKFQRLFTYRNSRKLKTFVINLTDKPLFVPYFGRRGVVLPVVTEANKDTVARLCNFRPTLSVRKRLQYILAFVKDILDEKVSYGDSTEIAADITALLSKE